MHDMLWIKKRRIFHSLNEATTSICYQTHIESEDGEHLLRIFHSLNESSTSSCYHLVAIISRHIPYTLHARCVLDQETQNVHSLNEGSPQTVLHSLLWQSGHVVHTHNTQHTSHLQKHIVLAARTICFGSRNTGFSTRSTNQIYLAVIKRKFCISIIFGSRNTRCALAQRSN